MTAKPVAPLTVTKPDFQVAHFNIIGTAPYMQNRFSQKAKEIIHGVQSDGEKAKGKKKREPKDFQQCFEGAKYIADGRYGIPAPAFRCAMISACRVAGIVMTRAKLTVFVEADAYDDQDGTPLVLFSQDTPDPVYDERPVRNDDESTDLRARPLWREGWKAHLRIRYDGSQLDEQSICNLVVRAGAQVGIGEGRANSKTSCGIGFGFFDVVQ